MCGISGFIDTSLSPSKAEAVITSMLESTNHRGPDHNGHWSEFPVTLGHNRLSIIDLTQSSNQPMHYDDYVITYNGELYNYIEIKEELLKKGYIFSTASDTEVVLCAYKEWGESCVEKFMGMWAFAIWSKAKRILFCSRDRFGIKPFNYIHNGNAFYFSSELKALKKTPVFNNRISNGHVLRMLQLSWVSYQDESFYESVEILPEACNLTYKNGKVEISRYWDVSKSKIELPETFNERSVVFRNMFYDSVKLHYRSDVEVGTCLSGGLDSSSIISVAASLFPEKKIRAFNIYYEGEDAVDERPYVDEITNKYKNIEPYFYSPGGDELAQELDKIIYYADAPLSSSSYVSQYFVMKLASQHNVKVLLDGQGSDEYLAGYMHTFNRLIGFHLKNGKYFEAIKILLKHKKEHQLSWDEAALFLLKGFYSSKYSENDIFNYELNRLSPMLHSKLKKMKGLVKLENHCDNKMDNFFYHLLNNTSLPTLLYYEDRNSMAFSIESRVPFLDHRLVEYSFALPLSDKLKGAETKYILRHSLSGILPDANRDRKDKKGFVTPGEAKWLRGPLKYLLEDDFTLLNQWINPYQLKKLIYNYKNGDNSKAKLLWRLIMLNLWLKKN